MTAITQPRLRPDRPPAGRPPLRVIEGGRSPRRMARYRRRRLVVAVAVLAIGASATVGVRAVLPALRPAVPGAHPAPSPAVSGAVPSVVVRQGDTLWSIARRIAPGGDVRAAVDRLAGVHGTGPLQVGERLPIAAATGR